jgi:hypothetical protein
VADELQVPDADPVVDGVTEVVQEADDVLVKDGVRVSDCETLEELVALGVAVTLGVAVRVAVLEAESDALALQLPDGVTLLDAVTVAVDEREKLSEIEEDGVGDDVLEFVTLWLAELVMDLLAVTVLLPLTVGLGLAVTDILLLPLLEVVPLALGNTLAERVPDGVLESVDEAVMELLAVTVLLRLTVGLGLAVTDILLLPLREVVPLALGKTLAERVPDGVFDSVDEALRVAVAVPLGLMTAVSWMLSRTAPFEPVSCDTNLMTGFALVAVNVYVAMRHPMVE